MSIYSDLITENGFMNFTIKGNSMEPFLKDGDFVCIKSISFFKSGNCYIFKQNNRFILHRLVCRIGKTFYFIGDNSNNFERIAENQICGALNQDEYNRFLKKLITVFNLIHLLFYNISIPSLKWYIFLAKRKILKLFIGV